MLVGAVGLMFMTNAHPDCVHACIFLVCDACGQATHLDDDSLSEWVRSAATDAGFSHVRTVIEVRGKCADCD
jgi:Fur family zinc uptake transcriptional regulator